ncbi:type III secretion system major needle protein, YscF/MxiH/PrgI family [Mesorhizobium albiziae]|uniref:Type III secretion system major needle protein, YscF/MxiH/PrgI family n=1 Tax=Neomesorhizobium albiziae TaxID=335020 RepID=A0A1I4FHT1_9HYPH|nr:type III secretion system inner rod subunit SctI [Mesorhizobium albiziae]GLS33043.1 hypothetical protein GCM10007937_47530 [Mesorhizobium albiziae]SFL16999.1 type III secretion system major needle protein, YscF/MxiH/PrgI family [Mesorhizobium albiziae]
MSVNSITPRALKLVLPTDTTFVSKISTESVDAFHAAFERPELSPQDDRSAPGAIDQLTEVARGSGVIRTPGDAILNSMEKLSASFTQAMEDARSTAEGMNPGEIHSGDWLSAQLALSALSLQCDILAKVVGKATQSLDTFLKNQ